MQELKTNIKKWGNSYGIFVPIYFLKKEKIKEGDKVTIFVKKSNNNVLREMFGSFKFKKPINELMKEVDKELYNE